MLDCDIVVSDFKLVTLSCSLLKGKNPQIYELDNTPTVLLL